MLSFVLCIKYFCMIYIFDVPYVTIASLARYMIEPNCRIGFATDVNKDNYVKAGTFQVRCDCLPVLGHR